MTILALAMMTLFCAFYLYALVNFQKELRRGRRNEIPGAKTIPLQWRAGQLSGSDLFISSAAVSSESPVETQTKVSGTPVGGQPKGSTATEGSFQEAYQFESVYLGPFLVVPIRNRAQQGTRQCVAEMETRRAT